MPMKAALWSTLARPGEPPGSRAPCFARLPDSGPTHEGPKADRLALHAWRLGLDHPMTGARHDWRLDPDEAFWRAAGWESYQLDED